MEEYLLVPARGLHATLSAHDVNEEQETTNSANSARTPVPLFMAIEEITNIIGGSNHGLYEAFRRILWTKASLPTWTMILATQNRVLHLGSVRGTTCSQIGPTQFPEGFAVPASRVSLDLCMNQATSPEPVVVETVACLPMSNDLRREQEVLWALRSQLLQPRSVDKVRLDELVARLILIITHDRPWSYQYVSFRAADETHRLPQVATCPGPVHCPHRRNACQTAQLRKTCHGTNCSLVQGRLHELQPLCEHSQYYSSKSTATITP